MISLFDIPLSIAGTIFGNQLSKELASYSDVLSPEVIAGVKQSVAVIFSLSKELQAPVVHAYVKALDYVFILAVPASVLASVSGSFVKNWNLKTRGAEGAVVAV